MSQVRDHRRSFTTPAGRVLPFTTLGFGTAPLGNLARVLTEEEADAVLTAAWRSGARYFDTAPLYGHGLAEARVGRRLKSEPRTEFILSTKVGRVLEPCAPGEEASGPYLSTPPFRVRFDYTRDGVLRSFEDSLGRLGVDRVDILFVHDCEPKTQGADYSARWAELTRGGGWQALADLRAEGVVTAIGMGVNEVAPCERLLAELDPDIFLLAGRYTLLEQTPLHGLMADCSRRGVGIVIGGPYNSGVLARSSGTFDYAEPPPGVLGKVERLQAVCDRFGVSLKAAALQFAGAHPAVVSVIPGAQTPDEVTANASLMVEKVPDDFWSALKNERLIDPAAPTPRAEALAC
ncbi:MAG TPA: aldo/keto reductase [Caulobacteraceae bacterium]|nr:aldo/keto reductase [Caulobacteraceae bacterium]